MPLPYICILGKLRYLELPALEEKAFTYIMVAHVAEKVFVEQLDGLIDKTGYRDACELSSDPARNHGAIQTSMCSPEAVAEINCGNIIACIGNDQTSFQSPTIGIR